MAGEANLDIDRVAELARLALTPGEKERFARQLADVLHHFERLSQVDVSGIEPTAHAFPVSNVWEEDKARPGLTAEEALKNAPERRGNFVSVPRVVE